MSRSAGELPTNDQTDVPKAHAGNGAAPEVVAKAGNGQSDEPDEALIEAAQRGDRSAFAQIVERHQGAIFGYLRARLLQASDAEDLTQEVFLRCYSCWKRFDSSCLVRPWLLGIARNLLREHARKIRRRKEVAWTELCLELDDLVSAEEPLYGDTLVHLPGCLEGLGDSARQAIEMRYCSQLRLAEIGEKLRRSEGAAKLLMFRARQALKSCLDRKFQAGDP
jgi:RNA polymerase sigma-70 factor (ECF subfamily)